MRDVMPIATMLLFIRLWKTGESISPKAVSDAFDGAELLIREGIARHDRIEKLEREAHDARRAAPMQTPPTSDGVP